MKMLFLLSATYVLRLFFKTNGKKDACEFYNYSRHKKKYTYPSPFQWRGQKYEFNEATLLKIYSRSSKAFDTILLY